MNRPVAAARYTRRNLDDALDRIFAACSSDADCRSKFPDAKRTLTELLERLRRAPPMVTFRDPLSDTERTERMTAQRVSGVIRLYAYVPTLAAMLPTLMMTGFFSAT